MSTHNYGTERVEPMRFSHWLAPRDLLTVGERVQVRGRGRGTVVEVIGSELHPYKVLLDGTTIEPCVWCHAGEVEVLP